MKKFINARPFLFGFLALVFGILFAISCFSNPLFLIALGFALFAFSLGFASEVFRKFISKHFVIFLHVLICFAIGGLSFSVAENLKKKNTPPNETAVVSGRIKSFGILSAGKTIVKLDGVSVNEKDFDGVFHVTFSGSAEALKVGQKVEVIGKVSPTTHWNGNEFQVKYAASEIVAFVDAESFHLTNAKPNLNIFEKIKFEFKKVFFANMSHEEAALSYGMFFGDTAEISDATVSSFRTSGIAHLLAVSGLNVAFLIVLLSLVFNFFRVNRKIKFIVISSIILIYAGTCGFSASVMRAAIMGVVSLFAGFRGKQYDGLSSLSITAILILTFSPFSLFDIGFLLSFAAVFGILSLVPVFDAFFHNLYPSKMSSAISVTLAAQIGTFPVSLAIFQTFSPFSLLTNLLAVPVAGVAYLFSFVAVIFVLPFSFLGFVLVVPELLLKFVGLVSDLISKLPFSQLSMSGSILLSVFFLLFVFFAGDFFLGGKKAKTVCISISVFLSILFFVFANI